MSFIADTLQGLLELSEGINDWLHQPLSSWSQLDTTIDEVTLCAPDGSLASLIHVDGMRQLPGEPEFKVATDAISRTFAARLGIAEQAHTVQVVFHYDPFGTKAWLDRYFASSIQTMSGHGIDVQELVEDWKTKIGSLMAVEHVWFVVWTHPARLPRSTRKQGISERNKRSLESFKGRQGQSYSGTIGNLKNDHKGFVSGLMDAFVGARIEASVQNVSEFLILLRGMAVPERTSANWKPKLWENPQTIRNRDPVESAHDYSAVLPPSLRSQIFPVEGEVLGRSIVRIGTTLHMPLVMSLQPEEPLPFDVLFRATIKQKTSWRMVFTIRPDGVGAFGTKGLFATTFSMASPANKRIRNAIEGLKAYKMSGGHVLRLQTLFDIWTTIGPDGVEAATARLQEQVAEMVGSIQGWGTTDVSEMWGAPEIGYVASLPGTTPKSPAPLAAAPLKDILRMLPLARPAVPWTSGSVLFRSPDGKPLPYALGSSQQAAWVEIGAGQQGAGKSVMINTLNWGFVTQPGVQGIPFLSVVDFGASSAGLIQTLQDLAPPQLKPFFLYKRLKMVREHGINPFDTGLGMDKPLPRHHSALVNILSLILTPDDSDSPAEGAAGLARVMIDAVYDLFSEHRKPKAYTPRLNTDVDEGIARHNIPIDAHTSWWEITHALFERNEIRLATMAQRYAMPVMGDLVAIANDTNVTSVFQDTRVGNEALCGFFVRRAMEAQSAYPIIAGPTQLDLGIARVISLDLDEVCPKGSRTADRQASLMFMLARHVLMGRFFGNEDDLPFIPERYRDYHHKAIRATKEIPKRWVVDEAHRMVRAEASAQQVVADLETATRESRKLMLSIGLYSQSITDMPPAIINLATSTFMMNAGSEKEVGEVVKLWNISPAIQNALRNIRPPSSVGANFLGLFKVAGGDVQQRLTNTLGPLLMTAFESRAEDRAVRDRLYKLIGVMPTLRVIAKTYPRGIKPEVDRRKTLMEDRGLHAQDGAKDIISDLVNELSELARSTDITT